MKLYANNNFIVVVDGTAIKAQFVKSRFNFTYKNETFSLFDDAHRKFGVKSGIYGVRNQENKIFADDLSLLNYLTSLRLEAGGSNKAFFILLNFLFKDIYYFQLHVNCESGAYWCGWINDGIIIQFKFILNLYDFQHGVPINQFGICTNQCTCNWCVVLGNQCFVCE